MRAEKRCFDCRETKLLCDFYSDKSKAGSTTGRCKTCTRRYNKTYYKGASDERRQRFREDYCKNRSDRLVSHARSRAKKSGVPFDLDEHREEIRARFAAGVCEMTGIPFVIQNGRHWASPSIDRIEPSEGYVYSNIRIVLDIMNLAMNAYGEGVLQNVMRHWLKDR